MTVLFRPKAHMMEQCARFLVDAENSIFEIPMKVSEGSLYYPSGGSVRSGHVEGFLVISLLVPMWMGESLNPSTVANHPPGSSPIESLTALPLH